jgi:hypothetical protein
MPTTAKRSARAATTPASSCARTRTVARDREQGARVAGHSAAAGWSRSRPTAAKSRLTPPPAEPRMAILQGKCPRQLQAIHPLSQGSRAAPAQRARAFPRRAGAQAGQHARPCPVSCQGARRVAGQGFHQRAAGGRIRWCTAAPPSWARGRIRQELQSKGLDPAMVQDTVAGLQATEAGAGPRSLAQEVRRVARAHAQGQALGSGQQMRFLISRGFGGDTIRRVVAGGFDEDDDGKPDSRRRCRRTAPASASGSAPRRRWHPCPGCPAGRSARHAGGRLRWQTPATPACWCRSAPSGSSLPSAVAGSTVTHSLPA